MRPLTWLLAGCAGFVAFGPFVSTISRAEAVSGQSLQAQIPFSNSPSTSSDSPFPRTNPTGESFFLDAKALIQDQINIASRLDSAMSGPDPNAVRAVDGQIVIHSGKVDRFMALHYPVVRPRCGDASANGNAQDAVTCDLLANDDAFRQLQGKLFARLNMLSGLAPVEPLPLVSGESTVEQGGIPVFKKGALNRPAPSRVSTVPDLPQPNEPLLGRPMKSAIGDYEPPIPPAITAPPAVITALEGIQARISSARRKLSRQTAVPQTVAADDTGAAGDMGVSDSSGSLQGSRPSRTPRTRAMGFTNPAIQVARADANAYDVYPGERIQHQEFLQEPHTGITRVLTRQQRERDMNQLQNRLQPSVGDRYPYAILVEPSDPPLPDLAVALRDRLAPVDTQRFPFVPLSQTSFAPRLAMQLEGDEIQLQHEGLDYGFMVDMGRLDGVELNEISAGLEADEVNLRPDLRKFFLDYRVPNKLEQLMLDRRRFLSAKAGPSNLPTLLSPQAPMEVGHTYLLRTMQFDAPEVLTHGKPVTPAQRRNLDETLAMPGKDLLVVFQPVAQRHNGSYTVLWRVLGEFPTPEMTDAADYATFEKSTIVSGSR